MRQFSIINRNPISVDMNKEKFSIRKRIKSFSYAFAGLKVLFREEHNSWIHATATVLVVAAGFLFRISYMEWIAILIVIGMVFSAEIINSSLERTADFVKAERDDRKRDIKDLGAAAVLVCAIIAAIVGIIIFLPKILSLLF
jgi:diacylglycerol kinase